MRRIMRHNTVHEHTDLMSSVLHLGLCTIEEHKADDRSRCVRSFLATAAKAVNIDVWLQNKRPQDAARTAQTVSDAMSTSLRHLVRMFEYFRKMGHGGFHCHRVIPSLTRTVARVVELLHVDGGGDFDCLDEISAQHPRIGAPLVCCSNPFCTNVTRDTEDEMMIRIAKDRATRCSGCHADKYCSPECQRSHWDTHHREVCLMGGRPSTSDAAEGEATSEGEACEASEGEACEASEGEACEASEGEATSEGEASMCSGGSGTTFSDRSGGASPHR